MIYAMFAMILLTFSVAVYLFKLRVAAVKSGEVKISAFRLNDTATMPTNMLQAARNYSNLFEMPTLFYVAGAVYIAVGFHSPTIILLSWLFVGTRIVHSWIHITNNNVIRRMQAFMTGNVCVLLIWILMVWEYASRSY